MNTKELIASELASVIDSLDQKAILNLLETPKNSDMGDIAFPAFSLAKVENLQTLPKECNHEKGDDCYKFYTWSPYSSKKKCGS